MRKRRLGALVALALVLNSGCVGVVVQSLPMQADVYVDGEKIGQTPCKFKAKTIIGCSYEVVVRRQGYREFRQIVESEFNPYSLFLLLSPLIVLIPFLGTVVPREVYAPLEPVAPGEENPAPVGPQPR